MARRNSCVICGDRASAQIRIAIDAPLPSKVERMGFTQHDDGWAAPLCRECLPKVTEALRRKAPGMPIIESPQAFVDRTGANVVVQWRGVESDHPEMVRRGWRDCSWQEHLGRLAEFERECPVPVIYTDVTIRELLAFCDEHGIDANDATHRVQATLLMGSGAVSRTGDRVERTADNGNPRATPGDLFDRWRRPR